MLCHTLSLKEEYLGIEIPNHNLLFHAANMCITLICNPHTITENSIAVLAAHGPDDLMPHTRVTIKYVKNMRHAKFAYLRANFDLHVQSVLQWKNG